MAKAVLIMDMPESCFGCNLCHIDYEEERATCQAYETVKEVNSDTFKKPDWCPLRELPKYRPTIGKVEDGNRLLLNAGWNDCLDEILKGKKASDSE